MPDPELVPIGTFAQAARLTVKTLRHYQAAGVLTPAWVDPASSYRYYRWDQLRDALGVTTLRSLDVPLERIRAHFVSGVPLHEILAAERLRLERQAARAGRALAVIEALRSASSLPVVEPDIVTWEDQPTLTLRGTAHADTLDADAAALFVELLDQADRRGLDVTAPTVGEYPLALKGSMTIAARLQLSSPEVDAQILPGGRLARVVHVGPHESLTLAYHALVRWLHEQRHSPTGPVYEHYVDDPATTPPHLLRTEVLHRIA